MDSSSNMEIDLLVNEIFKPIFLYEGVYEISNYGRIKCLNWKGTEACKIRKLQIDKDGYFRINLIKKGVKNKCFIVHQLVGKHFILAIPGKPHINHIDGNNIPIKLTFPYLESI
jgi:hypothetical protein